MHAHPYSPMCNRCYEGFNHGPFLVGEMESSRRRNFEGDSQKFCRFVDETHSIQICHCRCEFVPDAMNLLATFHRLVLRLTTADSPDRPDIHFRNRDTLA